MKELSLVFTGDIGFDRYMDGKWEDEKLISRELLEFLHSADHVVANVEGPLVAQPVNQAKDGVRQLVHTMNPEAVKVLRRMHADVWNLCNNHIMDAGPEGLYATLREAQKCGAAAIGAGRNLEEARKPLYFEEAGGVGLFAVGYRRGCKPAAEDYPGCYMWNETEQIRETVAQIKKRCRWCILVAHAGEEFTALPTRYTRDRYLEFLEMGVDIIVAHHPHVPMNYERVGDKIIFYSLGNFIFDTDYQRAQYNTERGILVKLRLTEETFDFEAQGLCINRESERIEAAELPDIFTDVPEEEYRLLAPLAAKMFVAATKRQQIYLNKDRWTNASEEEWREHFADPKRSGRVPGEALDFQIVCPIAEQAEQGDWKQSRLEAVKNYILAQMPTVHDSDRTIPAETRAGQSCR